MQKRIILLPLVMITVLAGCSSPMPSGPSVMVLPGANKNFEQFRLDDTDCKSFAQGQLGDTTASTASDNSGLRTAALGTVLGTVAGAAANGSRGAAVGAGAGMAMGGLAGVSSGNSAARTVQQRYDTGYQQCMYSKGHKIPGSIGMMGSPYYTTQPQSQSQSQFPPPPPPPLR